MNVTKKAAASTATHKKIVQQSRSYPQGQSSSTEIHRAERIRKHRAEIPTIHRKIYDRAMQGKSRGSAVKAFCLECCGWQKEEVKLCTSLTCPLYPYRPYKDRANHTSEGLSFGVESKNSGERGL